MAPLYTPDESIYDEVICKCSPCCVIIFRVVTKILEVITLYVQR